MGAERWFASTVSSTSIVQGLAPGRRQRMGAERWFASTVSSTSIVQGLAPGGATENGR
jgi:hypothetical protein